MRVLNNEKGLKIIKFKDFYGLECSLEKTSFTRDGTIWLGCNDADPKVFSPGTGWQQVPMPKGYIANTKMHLSREQVKKLLPHLIKFVETGEIK